MSQNPNQLPPGYQQDPFLSELPPQVGMGKTKILELNNNIAGLLCYVPMGVILAVIFLLTEPKENRFVRFHAAQSVVIAATVFLLSIVLGISAMIIGMIPVINVIFAILMIPLTLIIFLGLFALMIMLAIKAYQNQTWHVPGVGKFADQLAEKVSA